MKVVNISKPSEEGTKKIIDEIKEALAYIVITFDPINDKYRLLRGGITDKQIIYIVELIKFNLMRSILDEEQIDE